MEKPRGDFEQAHRLFVVNHILRIQWHLLIACVVHGIDEDFHGKCADSFVLMVEGYISDNNEGKVFSPRNSE